MLAVSAAALAAVVAPWACAPPSSMKKAPYSPPAFVPEGWTYAVISPEPISAGYRLSLSVGFGATHGPEGAAPDGQGREEAPAAPAPAVSADRRAAPDAAPEFRLLLDRTGEASFVCLRWNAGYLEILRLVDGRPTGLVGQTFAEVPLARFADACLPVVMAGANGGPSAVSILVDRRPGLWSVTLGGEEVLTVGDPDGLPLGRRGADLPPASAPSRTETAAADGSGAGTAPAPFEPGVAWGATSGWSLLGRAVQPLEPIQFEDSFAREDFNGTGSYEIWSGAWDPDGARDAVRTVNAFRIVGRSVAAADGRLPPAIAVVGHGFWRDYRVEASASFGETGAGGLVFGAGSRLHYGLLRLQRPGSDGGASRVEVCEVTCVAPPPWAPEVPPVEFRRVLASFPWAPRRDEWYRVAVSLDSEAGEVEVAGRRATFPLPAGLRSGRCGLYADSVDGVVFDDVAVRSHGEFLVRGDSIVLPWAPGPGGGRLLYRLGMGPARLRALLAEDSGPLGLSWPLASGARVHLVLDRERSTCRIVKSIADATARQAGPAHGGGAPPGRILAELASFSLAQPPNGAQAGAEYEIEIADQECVVLGGPTVLGRATLEGPRAGPIEFAGDPSSTSAERRPRLVELVGGPLAPLGLLRHKSKAFSEIDVRLSNKGEVYDKGRWEEFVAWIEDQGTWERDARTGFLRARTPLWGSVEVAGDFALPGEGHRSVELRLTPDAGPDGTDVAPVGLGVVREGDRFVLLDATGQEVGTFPPGEGKGGGRVMLSLVRRGDVVAAHAGGTDLSTAAKTGARAIFPGGPPVFTAALPSGVPVHVDLLGEGVSHESVTIRAESVDESLFENAPAEWSRWRGHLGMTNKWQCDPRWAFAGIWSDAVDAKTEAAGIFSRASYLGDQDLQFYFAFKDMLGGLVDRRRYVRRDLNFAFACEGEDLESGYCVLLGGFDNRGTQLMRRGVVVAESDAFRFPPFTGGNVADIHWRWYRLRLTARRGTVRVLVDGKEILSWKDPEPIRGGHVAVWTLGGGMILGRTRFSSELRGPRLAPADGAAAARPEVAGWRAGDAEHPVGIRPGPGGIVTVVNRSPGGHFAVRKALPAGAPADSALAFRAPPGVEVRAYAGRGDDRRPLAASVQSALPADGLWHVVQLGAAVGEGEDLIVGNWHPTGYVAAGIGANGAGASYEVGWFSGAADAERAPGVLAKGQAEAAGR